MSYRRRCGTTCKVIPVGYDQETKDVPLAEELAGQTAVYKIHHLPLSRRGVAGGTSTWGLTHMWITSDIVKKE
jgi:hypothetical protein